MQQINHNKTIPSMHSGPNPMQIQLLTCGYVLLYLTIHRQKYRGQTNMKIQNTTSLMQQDNSSMPQNGSDLMPSQRSNTILILGTLAVTVAVTICMALTCKLRQINKRISKEGRSGTTMDDIVGVDPKAGESLLPPSSHMQETDRSCNQTQTSSQEK